MNKENNQLHLDETSSSDASQSDINRNLLVQAFTENGKEIQSYLNKYLNIYLKSDQEEQMMIAELDAFHAFIKDYESYLNVRINSFKERIVKITQLFGHIGSD